MTGVGTRDHDTLGRLWADLERIGSQYESGLITERELLEQHWRNAGSALAASDDGSEQ